MIPSTPRLMTPLRWPMVSPSAARRNGVASAMPDATVTVRTSTVKNWFIGRPSFDGQRWILVGPTRWTGSSRASEGNRLGASAPAQVLERHDQDDDDPAERSDEVRGHTGGNLQRRATHDKTAKEECRDDRPQRVEAAE